MEAKRAKTNDMALAKKTIDTIRVLVRLSKPLSFSGFLSPFSPSSSSLSLAFDTRIPAVLFTLSHVHQKRLSPFDVNPF